METPQLNDHNKAEYPPMHTAEHILNQTMVRMFGCGRASNAHIERKKSKCDYNLPSMPTDEQIAEIEAKVNEVIAQNLPVFSELMTRDDAKAKFNLERLPEDASETLKIVHVGDYDACPCICAHVENTSEIDQFKILSSNYENGIWRVRWKITNN